MKTAWTGTLVILFLALIFPITAAAEFYRYVDPHGNVIYTDDLSKVPVDKRPQATIYDESQSNVPSASDDTASKKGGPAKDKATLEKEAQRLQVVEDRLNQEYNDLVKENAALKTEQQEAVTPEQIKAVNKKVVSFNARFKAYQEKKAAYTSELDAYKEQVKAAEAEKPEEN